LYCEREIRSLTRKDVCDDKVFQHRSSLFVFHSTQRLVNIVDRKVIELDVEVISEPFASVIGNKDKDSGETRDASFFEDRVP